MFSNRAAAGRELAGLVKKLHLKGEVLVLGLPRGGVPVAFEVARALAAPLDVLCVRKIGMPDQPECAIGALAVGNVLVRMAEASLVSAAAFRRMAAHESAELERRALAYRVGRPPLDLANKQVILVDDGLATGTTMQAAVRSARQGGAASVTVAVPVASRHAASMLANEADHVCCLQTPSNFQAVGQFFADFAQTGDSDVLELLRQAASASPPEGRNKASAH